MTEDKEEYEIFVDSILLAAQLKKDGTKFPVYLLILSPDDRYTVARFETSESALEWRQEQADWPKQMIQILAKKFQDSP